MNFSLLARSITSSLNPTPLNVRIREEYGLNDSYKLIYITPNERMSLIANAMGLVLLPIVVTLAAFLMLTEITGRSKFSESYENPMMFFSFVFAWFGVMLFSTIRIRSTTVLRIYHSQKEKKFVLFRLRGIIKLIKEDFEAKNFILRTDKKAREIESKYVSFLTKFHGNVFINNRLRQIDFKQFISPEIAQKLCAQK